MVRLKMPQLKILRRLLLSVPLQTATQVIDDPSATPTVNRARERERRIALTTVASTLSRVLSVGTMFVTVPLTFRYLGAEQYGVWVTLSTVIALMSVTDLGLGNGLVNTLSEANGRGDRFAAAAYISSATAALSLLALVFVICFGFVYPMIPWSGLLDLSSAHAARQAGPTVAVLVVGVLATLPMSVVGKVQFGYQEGFKSSLWAGVGSLLSLVMLLIAIFLEAGLPWLALASVGGPFIAATANTGIYFGRTQPRLRPRIQLISRASTIRILQSGLLFFILQIAYAVSFQSDALIISRLVGPASVTDYAIAYRLFFIAPVLISFALGALWPAFSEAVARGDIHWVKYALRRSMWISAVLAFSSSGFLLIFGTHIIHVWVGKQVTPSTGLLFGMALWAVTQSLSGPLAAILTGAQIIKFQVKCLLLMAVANVGLSITLVRFIGTAGVVYGTVIALTLFILVPSGLYVPRLLNQLQSKQLALVSQRVTSTNIAEDWSEPLKANHLQSQHF